MAFKKLQYFVTDKHVIIETSFKNLCFMKTSTDPIIKRWTVSLQQSIPNVIQETTKAYDTIFKAPPIKNSFFQIPYDNSNHNLLWDGLYPCTYTNSQINNYDNDNDTSTIPIIDIHDDDDVNYDDLPPLLEHIDAYAHAC